MEKPLPAEGWLAALQERRARGPLARRRQALEEFEREEAEQEDAASRAEAPARASSSASLAQPPGREARRSDWSGLEWARQTLDAEAGAEATETAELSATASAAAGPSEKRIAKSRSEHSVTAAAAAAAAAVAVARGGGAALAGSPIAVAETLREEAAWLERRRREREQQVADEPVRSASVASTTHPTGPPATQQHPRNFIRNIYRKRLSAASPTLGAPRGEVNWSLRDARVFPMGRLSSDLVFHVLCFLHVDDLTRCAGVCRGFQEPTEDALVTTFCDVFGERPQSVPRRTVLKMLHCVHYPSAQSLTDAFLWAAARGYLAFLAGLQTHGLLQSLRGGVNAARETGHTAVHVAAQHGRVEVLGFLLAAGADAARLTRGGRHALHCAAEQGQAETLRFILEHVAVDPDVQDETGCTPLFLAAAAGHAECVRALLERKVDENRKGTEGKWPLFVASEHGHTSVVEQLLRSASDVTLASETGKSALFVAAENGHADAVKLLLDYGSNVRQETFRLKTALYVAAEKGFVEVAKHLLRYARVDDLFRLSCYGTTPMSIAAKQPSKAVKRLFMQFCLDAVARKSGAAPPSTVNLNQLHTPRYLEDLEAFYSESRAVARSASAPASQAFAFSTGATVATTQIAYDPTRYQRGSGDKETSGRTKRRPVVSAAAAVSRRLLDGPKPAARSPPRSQSLNSLVAVGARSGGSVESSGAETRLEGQETTTAAEESDTQATRSRSQKRLRSQKRKKQRRRRSEQRVAEPSEAAPAAAQQQEQQQEHEQTEQPQEAPKTESEPPRLVDAEAQRRISVQHEEAIRHAAEAIERRRLEETERQKRAVEKRLKLQLAEARRREREVREYRERKELERRAQEEREAREKQQQLEQQRRSRLSVGEVCERLYAQVKKKEEQEGAAAAVTDAGDARLQAAHQPGDADHKHEEKGKDAPPLDPAERQRIAAQEEALRVRVEAHIRELQRRNREQREREERAARDAALARHRAREAALRVASDSSEPRAVHEAPDTASALQRAKETQALRRAEALRRAHTLPTRVAPPEPLQLLATKMPLRARAQGAASSAGTEEGGPNDGSAPISREEELMVGSEARRQALMHRLIALYGGQR